MKDHYREMEWRDLVSLALLLVAVALLFLLFIKPIALSDQIDYIYHGANPDQLRPVHRHLRIGLIFPVSMFSLVFGYSELTYYSMPFVSAILLSFGTWLLGRVLFDRWVGFLAGLLIICNPWVLADLSHPLPDFLSAGLFTTAIALFVWVASSGRITRYPFKRSDVITLFGAGFLIGWAYLAREYVVILFPIALLVFFVARAHLAALVPLAVGAFAGWAVELVWGFVKFGNPIIRLTAVSGPRETERVFREDVLGVVMQFPDLFLARSGGWFFVALLLLGTIGSVVAFLRGHRMWGIIAAWLVGSWLFYTAIGLLPILVFEERAVLLRLQKFRYWALILPPLMVGGVAVIFALLRWALGSAGEIAQKAGLAAAAAAIVVLAAQPISEIWYSRAFIRNASYHYHEFREFARSTTGLGDRTLVLWETRGLVSAAKSLPFFLRPWHGFGSYPQGPVDLAGIDAIVSRRSEGETFYLAVDLVRPQFLRRNADNSAFLDRLPSIGEEVFSSTNGRVKVYRIN